MTACTHCFTVYGFNTAAVGVEPVCCCQALEDRFRSTVIRLEREAATECMLNLEWVGLSGLCG